MTTMRRPKERLAIRARILAIARRQDKFSHFDCIIEYNGEHYSNDWQVVLDSLVANGTLQSDANPDLTNREYWKVK